MGIFIFNDEMLLVAIEALQFEGNGAVLYEFLFLKRNV